MLVTRRAVLRQSVPGRHLRDERVVLRRQLRIAVQRPEADAPGLEIARLEGLVKKLQSELAAEREYVRSLEEHFKIAQQG